MANLYGLSPQEISAIGARRSANQANQLKMAGMLVDMLGSRQQAETARRKQEFLENPPMVKIRIAGQIYEIPRGSQLAGAKAKSEVEERYRTGRIDQAQHDAWMKPIKTSMPSKAGEWIEYDVPSGMLKEMATGAKSLQAGMTAGAEETRKREGLAALGGQTIGDIEGVPLSTLATTMPGGVIPAMLAKPRAGVGARAGIKPEERRKLIMDQENSAFKMLEEGADTSEASVSAYNDRSKTLGYPSMMLKVSDAQKSFLGIPYTGSDLIEVKLPVVEGEQITPAQVEKAAKDRGISAEEVLQIIYKGQQLREK